MPLDNRDKSLRALLDLLLLIAAPSCAAQSDSSPHVEFAFKAGRLYVGESPTLVITVTAPPRRAASVINADRVRTRQCLGANMVGPDGRECSLTGPSAYPVYADGDFSELPAGQSRRIEFPLYHLGVKKAGEHRVQVVFTLTADPSAVVRRELTVSFRAIPEEDIACRVRIPVPANPHRANQDHTGSVEFLNVRTEKGYEMLFHYMDGGGGTLLLARVHDLDRDSTLTVVPKYFDEYAVIQQYWVVFNRGGVLYLTQHSHPVGHILAKTVIEGRRPEMHTDQGKSP